MTTTLSSELPPDLNAKLEGFAEEAGALLKPFLERLEAEPPPPLIYHYTDERGLRGILGGGKLWLTDAFQLNDPSELSHGVMIMNDRFAERLASCQPEVRVFAESIRRFSIGGGVAASAHYFVGSFSTLGNDLTQWTRYADDGLGYVLAFDPGALEQKFAQNSDSPWNTASFPVNYDDAAMVELVEPLLDLVIPLISLPRQRAMSREEVKAYMRHLEIWFALAGLHRNMFFKNGAYRSESEYRFLEVHRADLPPPQVKIRERAGQEVRYRELDWRRVAPNALKSITVGPAAQQNQLAFAAVHETLAVAGLGGVAVDVSRLPYRSFKAG